MAQLVIIPAVITLACIGAALLFGMLAGEPDDLATQLARLEQSGGSGRGPAGFQDPRYKDRWMAAAQVAQMIRELKDPAEKVEANRRLKGILEEAEVPGDELMISYLLVALGQLGEEGGLDVLQSHLTSPDAKVQVAAIGGILSWPNLQEARAALPALHEALEASEPQVRTAAAAALGTLAEPGDEATIAALRKALHNVTGVTDREAGWNAALSLARLHDPEGSQVVAELLLNREELSKLPAPSAVPGPAGTTATLAPDTVDRLILSTLSASATMADSDIQARIEYLAENDPVKAVRLAAARVLSYRQTQERKQDTSPPELTPEPTPEPTPELTRESAPDSPSESVEGQDEDK